MSHHRFGRTSPPQVQRHLSDVLEIPSASFAPNSDPIEVTLNGIDIGDYTPGNTWTAYTTAQTSVTSSTMTLDFIGAASPNVSYESFIAGVSLVDPPSAPEPASFLLAAPLGIAFLFWRRRRAVLAGC